MAVLTTISPVTNQPILTREEISPDGVAKISRQALEAFKSFGQTSLEERQAIVKRALQLMLDQQDVLARDLTEQMGRPIAYTPSEIQKAVQRGEHLLKISGSALESTPGEPEEGYQRYIRKVPVGPVLVLFAWNYPYLILINSLVPALLAGNSVILKPSPQTPTVVEHVESIFRQAGLPEHVIQYFHCGSPQIIESMVQDEHIKLVCFVGSVTAGLAVQKAASGRIINVGLELGGKDPAYIRDDVDVQWAAEEIVDGAVFNSGQSCCSIERVYVHERIHDQFVQAVQKVLETYVLGDPMVQGTNVGPVISSRSKQTIEEHINDALSKGAHDVTPQNQSFMRDHGKGHYVYPRLLTGVTHNMLVMTDETFGPVIPVMKVSGDEEAVALANDTKFGLTASIWTKDIAKGGDLAEQIEAGTVFVNRCDYPSPDLAWTGFNTLSGRGASLSKFGFDQFTKLKSFHIKNYPKT